MSTTLLERGKVPEETPCIIAYDHPKIGNHCLFDGKEGIITWTGSKSPTVLLHCPVQECGAPLTKRVVATITLDQPQASDLHTLAEQS